MPYVQIVDGKCIYKEKFQNFAIYFLSLLYKAAQAMTGVFICCLGLILMDVSLIYTLPSVLVNIILETLRISVC